MGKPFDPDELRARLIVAMRVVELRRKLAERVRELETAISRVKQLHGLLPICAYCKKIRDDKNYWQRVEEYVSAHTDAQFSHGICPQCYEEILTPQLRAMREARSRAAAATHDELRREGRGRHGRRKRHRPRPGAGPGPGARPGRRRRRRRGRRRRDRAAGGGRRRGGAGDPHGRRRPAPGGRPWRTACSTATARPTSCATTRASSCTAGSRRRRGRTGSGSWGSTSGASSTVSWRSCRA